MSWLSNQVTKTVERNLVYKLRWFISQAHEIHSCLLTTEGQIFWRDTSHLQRNILNSKCITTWILHLTAAQCPSKTKLHRGALNHWMKSRLDQSNTFLGCKKTLMRNKNEHKPKSAILLSFPSKYHYVSSLKRNHSPFPSCGMGGTLLPKEQGA